MSCSIFRNDQGEVTKVLAPNGRESILFSSIANFIKDKEQALHAWAQVYTPSFKAWFGDWEKGQGSKVVDANGEPALVYHGTAAPNFEAFQVPKWGRTAFGKGLYFTKDYKAARDWANQQEIIGQVRVLPVFLSIVNPQTLTEYQSEIPQEYDGAILGDLEEVVAKYEGQVKSAFNEGSFSTDTDNIYLQAKGTESSKASAATLKKVAEFLNRIGVDTKKVNAIVVNGKVIGANGVADALNKLIQVVHGKEDVALTEEAMHMAVEMLEQTNPAIFDQMFKQIGSYQIYKETFEDYRDLYKTADGKPDIRKIKKEAMGKLLAEMLIQEVEGTTEKPELMAKSQSWWSAVKEFFRSLFIKAQFNPFEAVAKGVASGQLTGDFTSNEAYFQVAGDKVNQTFDRIMAQHNKLGKEYGKDGKGKDSNWYVLDGKRVENRVHTIVQKFYDSVFPGDKKTAAQEAYADFVADKGTAIHADMEHIFDRYIDEHGFKRDQVLPMQGVSQADPNNPAVYAELEKYFAAMLDTYPAGTRFLKEVMMYNPTGSKNLLADMAGTVDFMAIIPNGDKAPRIDIKDWKSTSISDSQDDVPWYKKKAYDIQIQAYREMLTRNYGVAADQFRQTRAIPILTNFKRTNPQDMSSPLFLAGIAIGNVDPKQIKDLRLLPVATSNEATGSKKLDALIESLNKLYTNIRGRNMDEERRDLRVDKLNGIERAIRTLQVQGHVDELLKSGTSLVTAAQGSIRDALEAAEAGQLTGAAREELLRDIFHDADLLNFYENIDGHFRGVDLTTEQEESLRQLANLAVTTKRDLRDLIEEVGGELALGYGVKDIARDEKKLNWAGKYFSAFSEAKTKTTQVFRKIWNEVTGQVEQEAAERLEKLQGMQKELKALAENKGLTMPQLLDLLKGKNKQGGWNGQLIRKVQKQAYTLMKEHQTNISKGENIEEAAAWLDENIDIDAYNAWYQEALAKKIEAENQTIYKFGDELTNTAERQKHIDKWKAKYGLSQPAGYGLANRKLTTFLIQDKWLTKEYQEVAKMPALLNFYNYWQERMEHAYKQGMIEDVAWSRFVPNVRRTMVEKMYFGLSREGKALDPEYFASLRPDDYVSNTNLSGEIQHKIRAQYVTDLGQWREKDGEKFLDYSDKSDDLLKVMAIFDEELLKFEHKNRIEGDIRILHMVEKNKKSYEVNRKTGEHEQTDNKENLQYFENFMNAYMYGVKSEDRSMDATYKLPINKYIKAVNAPLKALGLGEVLPYSQTDEVEISVRKQIEGLNRFFRLKTLAAHVPSALTNYLGGKVNTMIQAGGEIYKADIIAAEALMVSAKFQSEESKKAVALLDYLFPFREDEKRVKYDALSVQGALSHASSDWMMYLQRKSDAMVRVPIQMAYLMNTAVVDGQLVNITQHVRAQMGYDSVYSLSTAEREQKLKEIETAIKKLKDEASLIKVAKIENDRIVIPGIDRKHASVHQFTSKVNMFMKDVLGNMDENDMYQYRMNILYSSAMMFKNWIPRMVKVRYGALSYNIDKEDWEIGRYKLLMSGLLTNLGNSTAYAMGIMSGKENLITKAKLEYQRQKNKAMDMGYDEAEFMSEAAFVDMYLRSATQAVKEVIFLLGMVALVATGAALSPGDDKDGTEKARYRFLQRLSDKSSDELQFFFNPIALSKIANGSIFPALGVLTDVARFTKAASFEAYYATTGDEKAQEKNKVAKHIFKSFPVSKELMTYVGLFDYEFAKDYGIQIRSTYRGN